MFIDEAVMDVKGGDGGKGIVAFRREKFVPRGGPNGGNGGDGGRVILVGDSGMNTLQAFRYTKRYEAGRGGHGGGSDMQGRRGEDLHVRVPVGTLVRDAETQELVADISAAGQEVIVANGGRGGRGNASFRSSTRQAPRIAELGEPGVERRLSLELKLLADVGLVGLPNAGKSTLLSVVSAATPKIADYPFTTLAPSLGVAEIDHETLVFADIPGLIEGASEGAGLGDRFLRHVERTRLLAHLVDGSSEDPVADWETINGELRAYDGRLDSRPQILVITKLDLPDVRERLPELRGAFAARGCEDVMAISAITHEGLDAFLRRCHARFRALPEPEVEPEAIPVLRPLEDDEDVFSIEKEADGEWRVSGIRIERTVVMTDWGNEDAVARFQRILDSIGIMDALRRKGVREGETVYIGEAELEWTD